MKYLFLGGPWHGQTRRLRPPMVRGSGTILVPEPSADSPMAWPDVTPMVPEPPKTATYLAVKVSLFGHRLIIFVDERMNDRQRDDIAVAYLLSQLAQNLLSQ